MKNKNLTKTILFSSSFFLISSLFMIPANANTTMDTTSLPVYSSTINAESDNIDKFLLESPTKSSYYYQYEKLNEWTSNSNYRMGYNPDFTWQRYVDGFYFSTGKTANIGFSYMGVSLSAPISGSGNGVYKKVPSGCSSQGHSLRPVCYGRIVGVKYRVKKINKYSGQVVSTYLETQYQTRETWNKIYCSNHGGNVN